MSPNLQQCGRPVAIVLGNFGAVVDPKAAVQVMEGLKKRFNVNTYHEPCPQKYDGDRKLFFEAQEDRYRIFKEYPLLKQILQTKLGGDLSQEIQDLSPYELQRIIHQNLGVTQEVSENIATELQSLFFIPPSIVTRYAFRKGINGKVNNIATATATDIAGEGRNNIPSWIYSLTATIFSQKEGASVSCLNAGKFNCFLEVVSAATNPRIDDERLQKIPKKPLPILVCASFSKYHTQRESQNVRFPFSHGFFGVEDVFKGGKTNLILKGISDEFKYQSWRLNEKHLGNPAPQYAPLGVSANSIDFSEVRGSPFEI